VEYLAERARQFHRQGTPWNEMAIVYRSRWMAEDISDYFKKHEVAIAPLSLPDNLKQQ
jgi:hypothetical protein